MSYRIEGSDIVIDGFESGISDTPYATSLQTALGTVQKSGVADMRNINIISIPGEAAVNFKTQRVDQTPVSLVAFTVLASTDVFSYTGTTLKVGTAIVLNTLTGGAGLATATTYWIKSATATTFTVSASIGSAGSVGGLLNVTTDGSGTFSTINLALLTQIVPNALNTAQYGIDTNGRAWVFPLSATATNWIYLGNTASANPAPDFNTGIAVWSGYIFILYNGSGGTALYTSPVTGTATFTLFKSLANTAPHRTFIDKSNQFYWCDGPQLGSLIQLTTFNPATATTYTYSQNAVSVVATDVLQCIEQLGTNLVMGGIYNYAYTWDRFSTGYGLIFLPEVGTHRMVTVNSNTYLFCGNRGRIFITNGANAQLYMKVPDHLSNTVEPYFIWGGATYNKNQLYFSISAFSSADSTSIPNYGGIWAIDTTTDAMRVVNQLSYGTYAGFTAEIATVTSSFFTTSSGLIQTSYGLLCGWEDSVDTATPNYGSDAVVFLTVPQMSNVPYSNYEAYIDSDMIPVGTYLNPKTDANVEYKLTVPMVAGEAVKLAYRQNLSQSFTTITSAARPTGEFTSADVNAGLTGVIQVNFQKSQWLQIRVLTKSTSTTPSYTRLRELRIR